MSWVTIGLRRSPRARFGVGLGAMCVIAAALAALAALLATGATRASSRRPAFLLERAAAPAPPAARPPAAASARQVEVIVQLRKDVALAQGRALVRSLGGRPGLDLHIINGLSARLSVAAARRLGASPLVHAVSPDAPIQESAMVNFDPWDLATRFNQSIDAPRLWRRSTGSGIGVAVIDTGISGDLPDFRTSQGDPTSRVAASAVIDPNATTAADTYGHGTAVAGLVAGDGGYRDPGDPSWGQYAGTAPDANLISVKIADDNGQATTLDAIYGLQFVVDHKNDYNIRVVNMSFRSLAEQSYTTDPLDAAVEQAWFDGITVVAAAGNLGDASDAVSSAPGNDPYVITVGAVDTQGTRWAGDDTQADWSSRGTTQDGFAKPDVLAPGAHIASTLAPGSAFASLCPSCVVGGDYFQLSGTSLAAPIVSGVAADLLAAHPDWTPDMVKGAIVNTAAPLAAGGGEVRAMWAYWANGDELVSNQNLTPNQLIDPSSGEIDYNAASWSAGSWSQAADPLAASWSAASWSCQGCGSGSSSGVDPTSASWSSASWSNLGWATYWG